MASTSVRDLDCRADLADAREPLYFWNMEVVPPPSLPKKPRFQTIQLNVASKTLLSAAGPATSGWSVSANPSQLLTQNMNNSSRSSSSISSAAAGDNQLKLSTVHGRDLVSSLQTGLANFPSFFVSNVSFNEVFSGFFWTFRKAKKLKQIFQKT